ncbi:unnamed protein product [Brachionus calyciflorus]|uniref:Uncharacterized protein n=1 Tax=Brachionus calyciflorus TaxID=104777 RepID=A0A813W5R8_9BILA|nr:unnamed protein product [Brachionus calyciflorus]
MLNDLFNCRPSTTRRKYVMNLSDFLKRIENSSQEIKNSQTKKILNTETNCRPKIKIYMIKIGPDCQTVPYNKAECQGYCKSQSMIWKNNNQFSSVYCCSIKKVQQKYAKIRCLKRLDPSEITNQIYEKTRDAELIETFKNSFTESSWVDEKIEIGSNLYTGYFLFLVPVNITCDCDYINI